jgi:hypothetical protein
VVEAPGVADCFKRISSVVPIAIGDAGNLRLLRDPETAVAIAKAQHLIEAAGERMKLRLRILLKGSFHQPDFTAAGSDGEPAVGEDVEAATLK